MPMPNDCRTADKRQTELEGIKLPRLAVAPGAAALPAVLALLTSLPRYPSPHAGEGEGTADLAGVKAPFWD